MATRSKSNGLAEALVAIQANAPQIPLDSTNPHFKSKFASLAGVMERVRPVATQNGVAIVQLPTTVEGEPALTTRLIHSSGDAMESTMLLLPAKPGPQGQGSALTYARRYMVLAMLGLVGDEDDDGNAGSAPGQRPATKATTKPETQLDGERVQALVDGIKALGPTFDETALIFGSVGAEAQSINRADAVRKALRALTPEQADAFEAELDRRAVQDG